MLTTDILPVAQKLKEQARNMAKEEEIFQQKKRSRHADSEDTGSIQEVILLESIKIFYFLLASIQVFLYILQEKCTCLPIVSAL